MAKLQADKTQLSISGQATQKLTLNAGIAHRIQQYWIFGSASGNWPETPLGPVTIPLVPDPYTDITIALPNSALLSGFRGVLDGNGRGSASFNIPTGAPAAAVGLTVYHSYIIYDFSRVIRGVSNAAPIQFIK